MCWHAESPFCRGKRTGPASVEESRERRDLADTALKRLAKTAIKYMTNGKFDNNNQSSKSYSAKETSDSQQKNKIVNEEEMGKSNVKQDESTYLRSPRPGRSSCYTRSRQYEATSTAEGEWPVVLVRCNAACSNLLCMQFLSCDTTTAFTSFLILCPSDTPNQNSVKNQLLQYHLNTMNSVEISKKSCKFLIYPYTLLIMLFLAHP